MKKIILFTMLIALSFLSQNVSGQLIKITHGPVALINPPPQVKAVGEYFAANTIIIPSVITGYYAFEGKFYVNIEYSLEYRNFPGYFITVNSALHVSPDGELISAYEWWREYDFLIGYEEL